jgi:hypothetical protein
MLEYKECCVGCDITNHFSGGEIPEIPAFLLKFDLLFITITPEVIVVLGNGRDIV